tara:strand:- start:28 stop:273 length:246 start_codon:yes stop_codon:yes gene_type:complete
MAPYAENFLDVSLGDLVVVEEDQPFFQGEIPHWWLGYVIHIQCGARDPGVNSLFQVVNVDTGSIRTINADLVTKILKHVSC